MSRASWSAAIPEGVAKTARHHLLRADRQEDLCFAIWYPSKGRSRQSALVHSLLLPRNGERHVHGNASFEPVYFERALAEAARLGAGLALMHSHPGGRAWQDISPDDIAAEQGNAGAVFGATGLPFVGLTIAGDSGWSARFWERVAKRQYARRDCATVRVVGECLKVTFMDRLAPAPSATEAQIRTVSAWGEQKQRDIVRLRVGVIGAGSVGGFIIEGLARTGFEDVMIMDYDIIELKNLDRLLFATRGDVGKPKAVIAADRARAVSTAGSFRAEPLEWAVYEEAAFRAALDCDLIIACVDRPWGRHVLNLIAYAHLIPVIDGGIFVRKNRSGELAAADWRAHTVTVGHRCLQCIGQYDPGLVELERKGLLDDPTYIENLSKDHPLRVRENVFAFSMSCASMQMLQALALVLDPLGQPNPGEQLYHFVGNHMESPVYAECHPECLIPGITALGDKCGFLVTGERPPNLLPQQEAHSTIPDRRGMLVRMWDFINCRLGIVRRVGARGERDE